MCAQFWDSYNCSLIKKHLSLWHWCFPVKNTLLKVVSSIWLETLATRSRGTFFRRQLIAPLALQARDWPWADCQYFWLSYLESLEVNAALRATLMSPRSFSVFLATWQIKTITCCFCFFSGLNWLNLFFFSQLTKTRHLTVSFCLPGWRSPQDTSQTVQSTTNTKQSAPGSLRASKCFYKSVYSTHAEYTFVA